MILLAITKIIRSRNSDWRSASMVWRISKIDVIFEQHSAFHLAKVRFLRYRTSQNFLLTD